MKSPGFIPPSRTASPPVKAAQRVAHENIYRADLACDRLQRMHGFHISICPRRRSMARMVNVVANKSGRRECFCVTKKRFLGAPESMGEQCHRMRSRPGRNKLQRRRVLGERHFLDADARLNPMGERRPKARQRKDAAAIHRLFLSQEPRILVIAVAQVFKISFISPNTQIYCQSHREFNRKMPCRTATNGEGTQNRRSGCPGRRAKRGQALR